MIADYFTKPLQGLSFRQLRDMIMGNTEIVLPSAPDVVGKPEQIPAVLPPQESRSVSRRGDRQLALLSHGLANAKEASVHACT
jgi:hypothetical protein